MTTAKTTTARKTTAKVQEKELLIYVGPSIPKTGLLQNTVLNNGLPVDATEHLKKCPAIKRLIIPIGITAQSRKDLATAGTPEHKNFSEVMDYLMKTNGGEV